MTLKFATIFRRHQVVLQGTKGDAVKYYHVTSAVHSYSNVMISTVSCILKWLKLFLPYSVTPGICQYVKRHFKYYKYSPEARFFLHLSGLSRRKTHRFLSFNLFDLTYGTTLRWQLFFSYWVWAMENYAVSKLGKFPFAGAYRQETGNLSVDVCIIELSTARLLIPVSGSLSCWHPERSMCKVRSILCVHGTILLRE